MTTVQIAGIEVGSAAGDGPVVQAVVTLTPLPVRRREWAEVAITVAKALVARDSPVEGVYAVFDTSSAASSALEFGKVLDLDEADDDALRRLGAGTTAAYAAVAWTRGGPRDGVKEPVLAVTLVVAPRQPSGLRGRWGGERGRGSVVVAVGLDGEVRHLETSRRPQGVGGLASDLAAAYLG
jgi:hypothetical protein